MMSTAAMNGGDGVKPTTPANASSKQQFKSSNTGKALDGRRKQNGSPVDGQNSRRQQQPQTKAWQGPNPITRAPSGTINGTEKPLPKLPPQAQMGSKQAVNADKHAHDRTLYLMANFQGLDATLTLKSGEQFAGVFSGGTFDSMSKSKYVLKMVRRTRTPGDAQMNGDSDTPEEYVGEGEDHVMSFDIQDTVSLAVDDVVTATAQPAPNGSISSSFRTDTEISGRQPPMLQERQLQRWDDSADTGIDMSLEASGETGWDQFATNERMYGVQSTYDENIYTTAIDRSDPRYRQKEAEAARIAREIEGSTATNAHVAEERRRDADKDDGLDEEEKYSGVRRESASRLPKRSAGAYVPPSHRPITGTPTVPGAPYDPAIISSSFAKAAPSPMPITIPDAAGTPSIIEPSALPDRPKPSAAENASRDTSASAAASQTPKSPAENSTEDHISKTIDAFKQFANNEKLKVRQAQEMKRAGARQEKNVKLNDLKNFAANFKLNSRVPDDLVPILAKDREKQLEIQRKADEAAKGAEVTATEKKKKEPTPGATPPAPSNSTSQTPVAPVSDPRLPFNQHSRTRVSQQMRGGPVMQGQTQSPRAPTSQSRSNQHYNRGGAPPLQPPLADIRVPTGPAIPSADRTPLSPSSATRFNINAMEFKPIAAKFTPSGTTPSPKEKVGTAEPAAEASANFFGKNKQAVETKEQKGVESTFNPVQQMLEVEHPEQDKKLAAQNSGVMPPYKTQPTWPGADGTSYIESFPKSYGPSQGPSPMHTPNPNGAPMAHAHQLPQHIQTPQLATPSQRLQYYAANQPPHGPAFDPRMQQFGPNGSVQSSPRFPPAQMAFGGQMPPHMQMPQFAGQPMHGGQFGMSPSMQPRQMASMPPGGPPMMIPGMPGQQFGQMAQGQRGFPPGGPQFASQHNMSAPMMVPNPSGGGGYMNGPQMPQQQQGYSPMPHHAQPHMQPHHPGHGTPGPGYTASPRPPMMSNQGSHHGFNPNSQMHGMPPFAPGHGQPHPMHGHWQRQMSAGQMSYGQAMTPRQQQAMPQMGQQHPSPGMGGPAGGQGDEVKGG